MVLAGLTVPVLRAGIALDLLKSKFDVQIAIRIALATINSLGLALVRRATTRRFGFATGALFVPITATQFHLPFWMGRTLPNMVALFPALTMLVDSYFWDRWPLWPELNGLYFNVYQGKSVDWVGSIVSDIAALRLRLHTHKLPKLFLSAPPLPILGALCDPRIISLLIPVFATRPHWQLRRTDRRISLPPNHLPAFLHSVSATPQHSDWVYNKTENLTPLDIVHSPHFSHAITKDATAFEVINAFNTFFTSAAGRLLDSYSRDRTSIARCSAPGFQSTARSVEVTPNTYPRASHATSAPAAFKEATGKME
ncbi:hypothetical protein BD410DRAFT_895791 [Rickenella mellea]|uniref:Mannosyltransferase n=1 Tax=Rickenella mellea TaxID=50990 RepID=A0A4Y7QCX3_9AGAM|nr:hypothetical protein BD410DRAFT_895791 [Rickenella mellea]